MERLTASMAPAPQRPVKVLQFGEGNFLRALVDYFIDIANEKTDFNGSIALVKPINIGTLFPAFKEQDYRYTVMLRGLVDGEAVEPVLVGDAMVAVPLTKGYHEIALRYDNPAFSLGWKITVVCTAILAGLYLWIYPARKKKGKYAK